MERARRSKMTNVRENTVPISEPRKVREPMMRILLFLCERVP